MEAKTQEERIESLKPESKHFAEAITRLLISKIQKGLSDGKIKNNANDVGYFMDLLLDTMEDMQTLINDYNHGHFDEEG